MALFVVLLCSTQSCQEQSRGILSRHFIGPMAPNCSRNLRRIFVPPTPLLSTLCKKNHIDNQLRRCFKTLRSCTGEHPALILLSYLNNNNVSELKSVTDFCLAYFFFFFFVRGRGAGSYYFLLPSRLIQVCSSLHVAVISYARLVSTESEL